MVYRLCWVWWFLSCLLIFATRDGEDECLLTSTLWIYLCLWFILGVVESSRLFITCICTLLEWASWVVRKQRSGSCLQCAHIICTNKLDTQRLIHFDILSGILGIGMSKKGLYRHSMPPYAVFRRYTKQNTEYILRVCRSCEHFVLAARKVHGSLWYNTRRCCNGVLELFHLMFRQYDD